MSSENDAAAAPSMSRRTLLRRTGTAAAGAAAVGGGAHRAGVSPVEEADALGVTGAILVATGAGVVTGAGIGYLAGSNNNSGVDEEEVENTLQAEDHLEIYNRAREASEVREENVLSSMETEVNLLRNVARENAVFAIFETAASGQSRSEAESAAIEEIDAVYQTPQERLITRSNAHLNGLYLDAMDLDVLLASDDGGDFGSRSFSLEDITVSFVDGSEVTAQGIHHTGNDFADVGTRYWTDLFDGSPRNELWIDEFDPADYDRDPESYDLSTVDGRQQFLDFKQYRSIWTDLVSEHESMLTEVSTLLDNYYDGISSGEIQMEELLAPASMIDTASEASDWQEAALLLDSMGLPKATEAAIVEFDVSDYDEVEGDVAEFEGMLGWSLAEQSDNGFPVGQELDPDDWPGNIYLATQWEDEESGEMTADTLELIEPFTITGTDGGSSELTFESRGVIEPDTDPSEAAEIFGQNRESEQQARETSVEVIVPDNGGGFSLDFLPSFGLPTPGGIPIWAWAIGGAFGLKKLLSDR